MIAHERVLRADRSHLHHLLGHAVVRRGRIVGILYLVVLLFCGGALVVAFTGELGYGLALLGFEVSAGRLVCYVPPIGKEKWLGRLAFMEPAGDRWWAVGGAVYMLQAIKRVAGVRLLTPAWHDAKTREKRVALAAKREGTAPASQAGTLRVVK